jgi:hypothetical protein
MEEARKKNQLGEPVCGPFQTKTIKSRRIKRTRRVAGMWEMLKNALKSAIVKSKQIDR